jgi:DNA-binding MurR/RpiR family transcriptional regulator
MGKRRKTNAGAIVPLKLSDRVALLSPRRQEIIRPALEHPRDFVLLSVRALAERLKTDPATMVRIVRGMSFASYREFQKYLHELSIAHATSLDTMQTAGPQNLTIPAQVRASLDQDLKSLNGLLHSLDASRVAALARRLFSARKILLIGGDLAANLVNFLEHHLMILGLPVTCATTPAQVVHKVRLTGKKDLVMAVSFRRGLRQTVEGLQQARANGAYCVGVADTFVSPIAHFAHECFLTSVDTPSFGASYVAAMAFLNVVVVACANYRRPRTLSLLKKVEEEQRHGFRWYEA